MRTNNTVTQQSRIYADATGQLIVSLTLTSEIFPESKTYALETGLPDSNTNRNVLCPMILHGMKRCFSNLKMLSKNRESFFSMLEKADKIFEKIERGTYGVTDNLAKKNGAGNFSAPAVLYYLFHKLNPLSREEVMNLTAESFNLSWLNESKSNSAMLAYAEYVFKDAFRKTYINEIYHLRGIILSLRATGRLPKPGEKN